MNLFRKAFKDLSELAKHIELGEPTFYHASQTSTVIPYDKLENSLNQLGIEEFTLGNLATLEVSMSLDSHMNLVIRGPVTWKDAREFCQSKGRQIMTSPTEELASMLSGIATSCTGERCFGFGTLRDQVVEIEFLDHEGQSKSLKSSRLLIEHDSFRGSDKAQKLLKSYQNFYQEYESFKNAPFPRMERETDLMVGTEGQLGVITQATFRTTPLISVSYIFIAVDKWEDDTSIHKIVFEAVQDLRKEIFACELIDENSWKYLAPEDIPRKGKDIIFLEINSNFFDVVYEKLLANLTELDENDIFEVPEGRCRELRMKIPRTIFEVNSKMGVTKKGTDVQSRPEHFIDLLNFYKEMRLSGVAYNLFGHFGDAHLHFNYMPSANGEEEKLCQEKLCELYDWVRSKRGSPFAEHGIGLIKQPFIKDFYNDTHIELFSYLKRELDPQSKFFPEGYMLGCKKSD